MYKVNIHNLFIGQSQENRVTCFFGGNVNPGYLQKKKKIPETKTINKYVNEENR